MANPDPGWHNDPTGRHQHRFWDGTEWTDQVADVGVTGSDPMTPATGPTAETAPAGAPSEPPGQPAPVPAGAGADGPAAPARSKSKVPLLIAAAVVLAVVVGGLIWQLSKGDKKEQGAGDFSLKVKATEATVHKVPLKAGAAYCYKVTKGAEGVKVAIGVDLATVEGAQKGGYLSDLSSFGSDRATDGGKFFSDLRGSFTVDTKNLVNKYPGFEGVFLSSAPTHGCDPVSVAGDYYFLFLSKHGDTDVELRVRTKDNPAAKDSISSQDFSSLQSDQFYSDSFKELSDSMKS
ncbi:MAG: Scramblase [Acidimicrobiales bacterium]|nr:Scramblase [Acidimicrobiales bacterium]